MGVGAASSRYPERTQVDKAAAAKRAITLPAASARVHETAGPGKPVAGSEVARSTNRAGVGVPAVTSARAGLLVKGLRAGRRPGGQCERGRSGKKLLSHQDLLRGSVARLDDWR